MTKDIFILAPLKEEREALLRRLPNVKQADPVPDDINPYYETDLPYKFPSGATGSYKLVIASPLGMGRVKSASLVKDALKRWSPKYVFVTGIAGGVAEQGVNLGDILIGNQIVDYELQKLTPDGPQMRWEIYRPDARLIAAANNFSIDFQHTIDINRPSAGMANIHVGPIASGDKVMAVAETFAKYRESWPRIIGVEMEAGGVGAAVYQASENTGFFMVRGVSDLADESKDTETVQKWRDYACNIAAAYLIAFLEHGPITNTTSGNLATTPDAEAKVLGDQEFLELANLLEISRKGEQTSRRSLCYQIGLEPSRLAFINAAVEYDFAVELVFFLHNTQNYPSLIRLCDVIEPVMGQKYKTVLYSIKAALLRIS